MHHQTCKLICAATLAACSAWAANDRSWVSNTGSDSNPCTAASPCRTFQHAHDATSAGGEVDVLTAGDYGTLITTKAITIDGGGKGYIEAGAAIGVEINAGRNAVTVLRNLAIHGAPQVSADTAANAGLGINWESGATLYLENVEIDLTDVAFDMSNSMVNPRLFVSNTTVSNFGGTVGTGFNLGGNSSAPGQLIAVFDRVSILNEGEGVQANYATLNISRSVISGCQSAVFTQNGAEVNVMDSELSNNFAALYDGVTESHGLIRIGGDNIHDNTYAVYGFGQVISYGNNRMAGNTNGQNPTSTIPLM